MLNEVGIGYFGHPDAYRDIKQFDKFEPIPTFDNLKQSGKGHKLFLTGAFGSGKSAILLHVQNISANNAFVWEVSERRPPLNLLDYTRLGDEIGSLRYLTFNLLLWQLTNRILRSHVDPRKKSQFSTPAVSKLKKLFPSVVANFGKKLLKSTKIKDPAGIIEIDFEKMFDSNGGAMSNAYPIDDWKDALGPCLNDCAALILLDDIEFIWPGIESKPRAVDALLSATETINDEFGHSLTCLVAMQYSTYLLLEKRSRRFGKLKPRMDKINWTEKNLRSLLANRVRKRSKQGAKISDSRVLNSVFEAKNESELEKLIGRVLTYCVNGPRDLIMLCNAAYDKRQGSKIGWSEFEAALDEFGDLKLGDIEREYQDWYPDLRQFIEYFFGKQPAVYSMRELEESMTKWLPKAREVYGTHDWLKTATRTAIKVLYEVGFIGYKEVKSSEPVFVLQEPFAHHTPAFFYNSELAVHSVFRQTLGMSNRKKPLTTKKRRRSQTDRGA